MRRTNLTQIYKERMINLEAIQNKKDEGRVVMKTDTRTALHIGNAQTQALAQRDDVVHHARPLLEFVLEGDAVGARRRVDEVVFVVKLHPRNGARNRRRGTVRLLTWQTEAFKMRREHFRMANSCHRCGGSTSNG